MSNSNRVDFQPDVAQLSPVLEHSDAPMSAPEPDGGNPFQRCSIPALTPVSADSLRQFFKAGIPQHRATPLPILTPPVQRSAPVTVASGSSTSKTSSTPSSTTTSSPAPTTGGFPVTVTANPGGQDKSIQVNSQGVFYGSPALTWDKVAGALGVAGTVSISGTTQIGTITDVQGAINAKVPQTTTINGHALSANVTISASDITTGTLPHAQLPALLSTDIPNIAESQVTNLVADLAGKQPAGNYVLLASAPASSSATGTAGSMAYDGSYLYVCTALNTWLRAGLSTF